MCPSTAELGVENTRLKKLLAEAELDKAMLKEIAEGNPGSAVRGDTRAWK
jgi:hypothetical protein